MELYLIWFNSNHNLVKTSIVSFTHYKVGDFNSYGHELIYKEKLTVEYEKKNKKCLKRFIFGRFIEKRKRRRELEYYGRLYEENLLKDRRSDYFKHF